MIILFTLLEIGEPFQNPYNNIAETYVGGLDEIAADFGASPPDLFDFDRLTQAVLDYLQPLYYAGTPPLAQQQQLNGVVSNAYNAYIDASNPIQSFFSPEQLVIVNQLLSGTAAAKYNGENSIIMPLRYIRAVEDNIGTSGLSTQEQAPLFLATAVATAAVEYFSTVITTPSADWVHFVNSDLAVRAALYGDFVTAAVVGTLIGITQSVPITPATPESGVGVLPNIFTALSGALGVTFGTIVYQWVTKPVSLGQMQLNLNRQTVSVFGGGAGGGTYMPNTLTCGCPIQFSRANCPVTGTSPRPATQLVQDTCNTFRVTCNTYVAKYTCVATCHIHGAQSLYIDPMHPNQCPF